MATLPSAFSRLKTTSPAPRVELGKPVASVTHLPQFPNRQPSPRANLFMLPNEPEDARITGGTRSLDRRLLALNLSQPPLLAKSA
jgi:hypothetical protein